MGSTLLFVLHSILAILLIVLILIQQDRSTGMGAGTSHFSQALFGSQGSTSFITRLTGWVALLFFATSLGLNVTSLGKVNLRQDTAPLFVATQNETDV